MLSGLDANGLMHCTLPDISFSSDLTEVTTMIQKRLTGEVISEGACSWLPTQIQ